MKNADFRKWQKALGATLSVLLAFTLAWASPMGGGFGQAAALGVVAADVVPMSDGAAAGDEQAAGETGLDAAAFGRVGCECFRASCRRCRKGGARG